MAFFVGGNRRGSQFYAYLDNFKLDTSSSGRSAAPSHTMFGQRNGSYKIPLVEQEEFLEKYSQEALRCSRSRGDEVCIVERHRDFGPVVIDLDFRYELPVSGLISRRHDHALVDDFIREYFAVLSSWVVLPSGGVEVYIMERPGPRVEKGIIKDGIHIVVPEVVTECKLQAMVRKEALYACGRVLNSLNLKNSVEDVIDEAVIQRNGWILLGSSKAGVPAYEITRVIRVKHDSHGFTRTNVPFVTPEDDTGYTELVKRLSIRRCSERDAVPVHSSRQADVLRMKHIEEHANAMKRSHPDLQVVECGAVSRCCASDFDLAKKLVGILSDSRADEFDTWMKVGWCLHNLDDRLLPDWVDFSRRSSKFQEGLCEEVWKHMVVRSDRVLKIGSLRKWAQVDSPIEYANIKREQNVGYVRAAISGLHHDVALATYNVFMGEFVCSNVKNNLWYRFSNHRWRTCDSGTVLRIMLSTEIYTLFKEEANTAMRMADVAGGGSEHPQAIIAEKMNKNADRLKTTSFKDAVMKELKDHFYKENFEAMLDEKPNLIGFDNGVYDLDAREFRKGVPEDMLTFSTRVNYIEYDPTDPYYDDINAFFASVQVKEDLREYLLKFLASCLHGSVREHSFHIAQGVGSNGKSMTIEFFEKAIGDYAVKLPVAFLTQKRGHSGAASPEVMRLKGKRFACLQEPGNDERLNVGLMKEVTGGDVIVARGLYKDCIEIKPQFRLLLTANNLPEVPSADGGTWRRIKLLPFNSRFVDKPDPEKVNEFKTDYDLSGKLPQLAPYLLSYLIDLYYDYLENGNPPPDDVTAATDEYKRRSDHMQLFIDKYIEIDVDAYLDFNELFDLYKEFALDETKGQYPRRQEFIANIRSLVKLDGVTNDGGKGARIAKGDLKTCLLPKEAVEAREYSDNNESEKNEKSEKNYKNEKNENAEGEDEFE